eukprot:1161220-Pelagomonas_calceolata.AAC.2
MLGRRASRKDPTVSADTESHQQGVQPGSTKLMQIRGVVGHHSNLASRPPIHVFWRVTLQSNGGYDLFLQGVALRWYQGGLVVRGADKMGNPLKNALLDKITSRSQVMELGASNNPPDPHWNLSVGRARTGAPEEKERKVYAGLRPHALREGPLTSRLAGTSPKGPQTYTRHS